MQLLKKISPFIILAFIVSLAAHVAAQNGGKPCYEIKYLDAFELPANDSMFFPDSFVNMNDKDKEKLREMKDTVDFMVPLLVYEMQYCHPDCHKNLAPGTFDKLFELYCIIRKKDSRPFAGKGITEKLDFVKRDFERLVNNDDAFFEMQFTFDTGPLEGENVDGSKAQILSAQETDFGSICTFMQDSTGCLMVKDKAGKILWAKKMTQNVDPPHQVLEITKEDIHRMSAAYRVYVGTEDHNIMLYMRPDGRFMGYYQHW